MSLVIHLALLPEFLVPLLWDGRRLTVSIVLISLQCQISVKNCSISLAPHPFREVSCSLAFGAAGYKRPPAYFVRTDFSRAGLRSTIDI